MQRKILLSAIAGLIAALPLAAQAQQSQSGAQSQQIQSPAQTPSLGDLARQLRAQQEKSGKKAVKVFTNDNIPAANPNEAVNSSISSNAASSDADTSKPAEKPDMHTKDYWQDKFKLARRDLAKAKEQQQLSEDELNLLQIQQIRELDPNAKADLTAKVQAKQSEVDTNKTATDAAQKALDDLTKDFKDSGAPDDWSVAE